MNALSLFCSFSLQLNLLMRLVFLIFGFVIALHWTALLVIVIFSWVVVVCCRVLWIQIRCSSAWLRVAPVEFISGWFVLRGWYFWLRVVIVRRVVPWVRSWLPRDIFSFCFCPIRVVVVPLIVWRVVGWCYGFYHWFFSFCPSVVRTSSPIPRMTVSSDELGLRFIRWWSVVIDAIVYRISGWIWVISICLCAICTSTTSPWSPCSTVWSVVPSLGCTPISPLSALPVSLPYTRVSKPIMIGTISKSLWLRCGIGRPSWTLRLGNTIRCWWIYFLSWGVWGWIYIAIWYVFSSTYALHTTGRLIRVVASL